jgi:hypothetical protein
MDGCCLSLSVGGAIRNTATTVLASDLVVENRGGGARCGCYGQEDGVECGENAGVGVMLCPH